MARRRHCTKQNKLHYVHMLVIRWRAAPVIWLLLSGGGCEKQKPVVSEQAMERIQQADPGMTKECLRKIRYGEEISSRVDDCFEMTPEQHWRGLWRDDFEGSIFCPAPAQRCNDADPAKEIWLSFADDKSPDGRQPDSQLYEIEFLGRRTLKPGTYGHMGIFKYEMIADRVISLTLVPEGRR
jgi:hypothetical protein